MKVKMDVPKIFFTPPSTMTERIILLIMLVITFIIFFLPLRFSDMSPLESIVTASMPALSISWGWILLLRSKFRKNDFCKK